METDGEPDRRAPVPRPKSRWRRARPARKANPRRYSNFVGWMKLILPTMAVALLGLVLAWPHLAGLDDKFKVGFASLSPSAVENLSMLNARYFGLSNRNQPFTVTADVATEDDPKSGLIVLDQPKADFLNPRGQGVYIEAHRGFYDPKKQTLDLEGAVNLYRDDGYELHTEKARVDLKTSNAEGHEPVTGQGPRGELKGQGFRIVNNGADVELLGRSTLNLDGAGRKK